MEGVTASKGVIQNPSVILDCNKNKEREMMAPELLKYYLKMFH
jgi:hypothetical protein